MNIYFTKKFEYKFNKNVTNLQKRILKVTILIRITITVQPHCLLLLQDPFKIKCLSLDC